MARAHYLPCSFTGGMQVEEQGDGGYRRRGGAIQVAYMREARDVRNTNEYRYKRQVTHIPMEVIF
jgi:hypothetical protein